MFYFSSTHPFSLSTDVFVLKSSGVGGTKPNIKLDHEVEILFELGVRTCYHHLGRNLGSMSSFILLELWHFIFFAILQMLQYYGLKEIVLNSMASMQSFLELMFG